MLPKIANQKVAGIQCRVVWFSIFLRDLRELRGFFASEKRKSRVEKVAWTKSRGTKSRGDLLSRKIQKQKVAGIYCRAKSENKKSRVLKVAKSRNIFARQLIPATFSTRDFLYQ